ncbi:MAG: Fe-S oxidoreductase [Rhodopirellula sp.]|nr:Fe-S oxidoreductase [Rhodopirellula sp.]
MTIAAPDSHATTPDNSMNREQLSADAPYLVLHEAEPDGGGNEVSTTTVFLTASRCPIGCNMCDLHLNTLPAATPSGAIARQIDSAIKDSEAKWLKLYNSGNFFDPRSIPPDDYSEIAERCNRFDRVIVENHPQFGRSRLRSFLKLITCRFEIAVGLETVQPRWLDRLKKQMTRDDFSHYASEIAHLGVDLRVFLILGVPGVDVVESVRWTRLSLRHAIACGARHVSIIPARSGHGWSGRADQLPDFPTALLAEIHGKLLQDSDGRAVVTLDLWDVPVHDTGYSRLQQSNLTQHA